MVLNAFDNIESIMNGQIDGRASGLQLVKYKLQGPMKDHFIKRKLVNILINASIWTNSNMPWTYGNELPLHMSSRTNSQHNRTSLILVDQKMEQYKLRTISEGKELLKFKLVYQATNG